MSPRFSDHATQLSPDLEFSAIAQYECVIEDWKRLLPTAKTKEGVAMIRLLENRCRTSVLHIRSLMKLNQITEIYDYNNPKPLSTEQAKKIDAIIESAMADADVK